VFDRDLRVHCGCEHCAVPAGEVEDAEDLACNTGSEQIAALSTSNEAGLLAV